MIFSSVRVNNDGWLFVASIFALWAFFKFLHQQNIFSSLLLGIALGLTILTKKNGLVLLVLPFSFLVWSIWETKNDLFRLKIPRALTNLIKHILIVTLAVIAISGWYYFRIGYQGTLTVVNPTDQVKVDNSVENFLVFQPSEIIANPVVDSFSDKYRRKYFWEILYKTWLFGEFGYDQLLTEIKKGISFTGLFVLAIVFTGILGIKFKNSIKEELPFLSFGVVLCCSIFALLYYRITHPYACNQDFRFILCAAPSVGYFFTEGTMTVINSKLPLLKGFVILTLVIHLILIFSFLALLVRT